MDVSRASARRPARERARVIGGIAPRCASFYTPCVRSTADNDTPPILGLRHLAIYVADARYEATKRFYVEGMGMAVDWQPDDDAIYLSGGTDNLALHRVPEVSRVHPALDHLGFIVPSAAAVEAWYARMAERLADLGIELLAKPRQHRDGSSSFYLLDPAGNKVQIVHIPSAIPKPS